MYCCWIFLDHDPVSSQRRVGALRILNSAACGCSRSSIDNISFMYHIRTPIAISPAICPDGGWLTPD
jgi:hypothetical protein